MKVSVPAVKLAGRVSSASLPTGWPEALVISMLTSKESPSASSEPTSTLVTV